MPCEPGGNENKFSLVRTNHSVQIQVGNLAFEHDGETVRIKLDPRFVSDFLRVLDPATTIQVELTDSQSAAVCRTDDGYGYVIMPLAVDA